MHRRPPLWTLVLSLALSATLALSLPATVLADDASDAPAATDTDQADKKPAKPKPAKKKWQWEGSAAEDATAKGIDAVLIRPLAVARVILGAALMIPASLFAAPSGREGIEAGYEVLVEVPSEYAFQRPLGVDL